MDILQLVFGFVILYFAGDALVTAAKSIALWLRVPAFVVSLTIVAFGTSAPELIVAIKAALDGVPQLALGNIVGSNIANILLVLGLPALLFKLGSMTTDVRNDLITVLAATLFFLFFVGDGALGPGDGILFLIFFFGIVFGTVYSAFRQMASDPREEAAIPELTPKLTIFYLVIGLIGLPAGAAFLVEGAIGIAEELDVPSAVIGLTIVAIGTSLPELTTTLLAARRGAADVAIGNVIGSNIFNLLAIGGTASLFGPFMVDLKLFYAEFLLMGLCILLIIPYALQKAPLNRIWGGSFCSIYIVYLVMLF